MQTSSTTSDKPAASAASDSSSIADRWATTTLEWPIDRLDLRVEIVDPRKLTALEWVLLRIIDEFGDVRPSLSEAAEMLGLHDPLFLKETVPSLVSLKSVAPLEGATADDFASLRFTDSGFALYQRGEIESDPRTVGLSLCFDALTDDPIDPDISPSPASGRPLFCKSLLGDVRQTVGLDLTAQLVRRFHRNTLAVDSVVRGVTLANTPERLGQTVEVSLRLTDEGELVADAPTLSPRAAEILSSRDLILDGHISPRPFAAALPSVRGELPSPVPHTALQQDSCGLVAVEHLNAMATALVDNARTELVLDSPFLDLDSLDAALSRAQKRGVRVLVLGQSNSVKSHGPNGLRLTISLPESAIAMPLGAYALIADSCEGLSLSPIEVRHAQRRVTIEAATRLRPLAAHKARDLRVRAAVTALRQPTPAPTPMSCIALDDAKAKARHLLKSPSIETRLALLRFSADPLALSSLIDTLVIEAPGLERLPLIYQVANQLRELAPSIALEPLVDLWLTTWRDAAALVLPTAAADLTTMRSFVAWSPLEMSTEVVLEELVEWATLAESPKELAERLVAIEAAVDRHWSPGTSRRDPTWSAARSLLIEIASDGDDLEQSKTIVRPLLSSPEAESFVRARFVREGQPDLQSLTAYLTRLAPLREVSTTAFDAMVSEQARRLIRAHPKAERQLVDQLTTVIPPTALSALFLSSADDIDRIVRVHSLFAASNPAIPDAIWQDRFRAVLPRINEAFDSAAHTDTVKHLATRLTCAPARAALTEWAMALYETITPPESIDGLPWFLNEVAALSPALEDVVSPVRKMLICFASRLRQARDTSAPIWSAVTSAYADLGGSLEDLGRALSDATRPPRPTKSKGARR